MHVLHHSCASYEHIFWKNVSIYVRATCCDLVLRVSADDSTEEGDLIETSLCLCIPLQLFPHIFVENRQLVHIQSQWHALMLGVKQAGLDRAVPTFCTKERNSVWKMDLDKLDFLLPPNCQRRHEQKKLQNVYGTANMCNTVAATTHNEPNFFSFCINTKEILTQTSS